MSSKLKSLKIGLVGATGMVGETFLNLLSEQKTPIEELRLFASESSTGLMLECQGKKYPVTKTSKGCFKGLDLVFFSAGDDVSKELAPQAAAEGAFAIDNSAAFRMSKDHLLIVPEVNGHLLKGLKPQVIANPNCSTIQLVVALKPLLKLGLKKVKVATYQAVSGAGKPGITELTTQLKAIADGKFPKTETFPHQIAMNCIPQIGSFNDSGFCSEETKIMNETKKILEAPNLKVSAFTVRIPALNSHSEAVWMEFDREVSKSEIKSAWTNSPGLNFMPQAQPSEYPTAKDVSGEDDVFIGRLHQDSDDPNTWMCWVVSDNLKKGAALNGLQIANALFS
jgi:aspartate-semialdehyde dehydrogenase